MQPLLTTKLFVPQISDTHIIRQMQTEKLLAGLRKNHQLFFVCAPAGYGKTTLVLEFLQAVSCKTAWISLDDGDNDAQRFLAYFAASLKSAGVDIGMDISSMITDISMGNPEVILTLLINRIAEGNNKIIAVFDDYHIIRSQKVDKILTFLLEHQPQNLHIIMISREDPQLPLAKLRMKGKLTEIRYQELLFTKDEAVEFFHRKCASDIGNSEITKITERTEGWIAGLQLAVLLINELQGYQVEEFLTKFDGTNNYIIDYLVEEVLEHLETPLREFLCRTSILERMNEQLCNELLGRSDSREFLLQLEKKNLFLIPLDYKKEWYRYHHLFADSLKTYLSEVEEEDLYKKAAIWMKKNGYSHEAVRYAFLSKDNPLTVKMIEDSTEEAFQDARLESLLEWLDRLPEELVIKNEIFCVRKGIALFITGRIPEGIEYLKKLGPDFMETASAHNKGLLLVLQAMLTNMQGKDAEPLASEALKYLEAWDPISRVSTMNTLGRARYIKGNIAGAQEALEQAYEAGKKIGYQFVTTLALMNYASCLLVSGQSLKAMELCNLYIGGMKQNYDKLPPYIGVIYLVMSEIYTSLQDFDKAEYYKEAGSTLCKSISFDGEASLKIYKTDHTPLSVINKTESEQTADQVISKSGSGQMTIQVKLDYGEKLSERETEILRLLGRGLSNQEIADTLFVTINTAQWHLSHIYSKLGVKSRTQAMVKAKELGLN